jgi:hypothetical protein
MHAYAYASCFLCVRDERVARFDFWQPGLYVVYIELYTAVVL